MVRLRGGSWVKVWRVGIVVSVIACRRAFVVELGFECEVRVELILWSKGGWISFDGVKRELEDVSARDEGEVIFGNNKTLGGDVSLLGIF
jgi:hypothetical protein